MKAVFDTNVLISAFLTEGVCSKLLVRARKKQFHLTTCPFILDEFQAILRGKLSATKGEIQAAVQLINEAVQSVAHPEHIATGACRDADDDNILDCLIFSGADYLVTGDADLLALKTFRDKAI
ncbi:MAG: putative toxin-antitoxin system toxin component, PIN family, partial [Proteobacteria bacterium]|nr:putative toxin-antitoxin system toxin component, PIN family [Pseudomonadota bacterium]